VPAAIDCDQEPDCDDFEDAQDIIGWSALQAYNNSVLAEMAGFLQDYKKQCFITGNFSETFTMDYTIKEYHYTLYFYDQAGNLERTVPPAGVQYIGTTGNPTFQNVTDYRKGAPGSTFSVPAHRYVTSYEYNSLNQLTEQVTPDAGTTAFWYDAIGKLRFSQNAKQQPFGRYSYTKYDLLGRIREVGESNVLYNATPFYNGKDDADFPQLQDFRQQVTYTYYDDFLSAGINGLFSGGQKNLRSRVTSVTLEAVGDQDHTTYDHASHYSYDIHGNVHHLIQDNPTLVDLGQRYKSLKYKYDLVSGNVNEVQYQPGDADQYYHRYWYDADNRITNVWTSRDGQIWDQDAKYYYYLHGPLARTETGHEKVQAMDYAYTVHGWIKGVNSNILDNTKDIGKDGVDDAGTGSYIPGKPGLHKGFAKDAMGYTLAYYRNATEADYTPIASGLTTFYDGTNSLNITGNDLYNGNIKAMAVALMKPVVSSAPVAMGLVDNHYRYDQLNRIMNANRYLTTSATSYAAAVNNNDYREEFTYDANGNIMSLLRKGTTQNSNVLDMDDLDYFYYTQSGGTFNPQTTAPPSDATNKLAYVDDDPLFTGNYTIDIDDQASLNYEYDEIGNLKKDVQEEIANIEWNVYGKIMKVTRTGNNHNKPDLEFAYDPMGNRIMKILKPRTGGVLSNQVDWTYTYYVRDAQGNVMAVYERTYDPEGGNNYSEQYDLKEKHIYGSSRLGMCTETVTIMEATFTSTGFTNNVFNTPTNYVAVNPPMGSGTDFLRTLGQKEYELGNHLGNILVTLSDRKLSIDGNTDDVTDHYLADVLSQNDYYAFGMQMPERSNLAGGFRYGFNGKEKDDEVKGSGNSYDFGARIYDSRLGRWLSVDPLTKDFPDESPYTFATNNPLYYVDPDGKKSYTYLTIIDKDGKETKMTIVNENETKDFQRYNYFWDDGSTYTEKWDFSQSVTIDYSKGKKPVVTTSEKHLIKRVDWRAVLKEKVFPFDGIAMSSKSGQGGGPPGKGYGRILNVDDLVSLLGGAGTSRTTNLPTTSVPNKYGATIDLIVKNLDNFLDTHGNFKDAFESMGGPWEPNKKTPGDTVCTNCNTEGNHGFGYKVYKEGKVVFEKNEEGGTETQTKSQPQSQEK
jgi:RHS repeat-associated protein